MLYIYMTFHGWTSKIGIFGGEKILPDLADRRELSGFYRVSIAR